MTKYTTIIAFILLLSGCSIKNNNLQPYHSSRIQTENLKNQTAIALPSVADFPFVEQLPIGQIVALKEQIKNNSDTINNLSRNQVLNLLGTPVVIKKTINLEIWQFRKTCILNIVWEKNTEKNLTVEKTLSITSNTPSDINPSISDSSLNGTNNKQYYSIAWLQALTPDKKDLKASECFISLANIS